MSAVSRRDFLRQGVSVVSAGMVLPAIFGKAVIAAAEESQSSSPGGKTLVVVQLAGGVDWLSTFVPYTDGAFNSARRRLKPAEASLLPVDGRIAFNPALSGLHDLFRQGNVGIVEGVGYENPNLSHFQAMDIWQTADPDGTAYDGWLGRYFEKITDSQGHPLSGLSIGNRQPTAFNSRQVSLPSLLALESFTLQDAPSDPEAPLRRDSLLKLYDAYGLAQPRFAALLDSTLDTAVESSAALTSARAAYRPAVAYPQTPLAGSLQILAEYIGAAPPGESPLRVGHVGMGGFDTHVQQSARLPVLLAQASEAITAFWQDLVAHDRANDVLIMAWTEFGRRVGENGQDGTDHGTAGDVILIGNKVKGGFHGEPASLTNLDDGNLRYTTDFRRVYASVLEGWLNAPAPDLLGGRFAPLDLLTV